MLYVRTICMHNTIAAAAEIAKRKRAPEARARNKNRRREFDCAACVYIIADTRKNIERKRERNERKTRKNRTKSFLFYFILTQQRAATIIVVSSYPETSALT